MGERATEIDTAPVQHLAETGSTNEDALALARTGVSGPLWIVADRQIAGRGRQGRLWESPIGNLYATLLLPVAAPPETLPQLSHVAAVALVTAVEESFGPHPGLRLKWPNDVLLDGAKLAGMLVSLIPAFIGMAAAGSYFTQKFSTRMSDSIASASSIAQETLSHIAVVQAFGAGTVESLIPFIIQDMVFVHKRNTWISMLFAVQGMIIIAMGIASPYIIICKSLWSLYLLIGNAERR